LASTDATPIPKKNVAYRVTFPILDADGDLVTGATGLDSEISKDAGTFADCTNEATEIATSSGMYYLDLTSTEMNADTVAVIVKTTSSGAKTTPIVMYPEEAGDIRCDVVMISGDATAADNAESFFDGTGYAGTNNVIPTVTTLTTKTGFSLSAAGIQAIWDALTSALTTASSIGKLLVDNVNATISSRSTYAGGDTSGTTTLLSRLSSARAGYLDNLNGHVAQTGDSYARIGAPAGASVSADIAAVKSETASIVADTGELQTDWADGGRLDLILDARASQSSVDTVDDLIDTEVAAIKTVVDAIQTKTDNLPSDPADASVVAGLIAAVETKVDTIDTVVDAVKLQADLIPANPADVSDIPTAVENADALLNRDMATGTDTGSETVRTVRQALRFLRNKWSITGTTLTVTKEDDTATSWTAEVSTSASADPITGSDPASS
jgi:hypothetical protein